MNKKVYFAGSIRAGRDDVEIYAKIISHIKKTDTVLTEHIGYLNLDAHEKEDSVIYQQDMKWLSESDVLIAECSHPSTGVGYELAYAEKLGIPCHVFIKNSCNNLSAMINGNPYYFIRKYYSENDLYGQIDEILKTV